MRRCNRLQKFGRNIAAMRNHQIFFYSISIKNTDGSFDFATKIRYIEKLSTFHYYSYNYSLGEAGAEILQE